mmetsp:Transcript_8561/g.19197  ORF Transcript_8561/g.19197 Transcript_8561/m.19197 type:complete len:81 (-) Transcript_8561:427-669(-)
MYIGGGGGDCFSELGQFSLGRGDGDVVEAFAELYGACLRWLLPILGQFSLGLGDGSEAFAKLYRVCLLQYLMTAFLIQQR